jgi:hypothetical protein
MFNTSQQKLEKNLMVFNPKLKEIMDHIKCNGAWGSVVVKALRY